MKMSTRMATSGSTSSVQKPNMSHLLRMSLRPLRRSNSVAANGLMVTVAVVMQFGSRKDAETLECGDWSPGRLVGQAEPRSAARTWAVDRDLDGDEPPAQSGENSPHSKSFGGGIATPFRLRRGVLARGFSCHALFAFLTPLMMRSAATLMAQVITNSTMPRMNRTR